MSHTNLFAITLVIILALTAACTSITPGTTSRSAPAAVTETAEVPGDTGSAATTPEPPTTQANDRCGGSLEGCFGYGEMDEYVDAVIPMIAQYFEAAYQGVPAPSDVVYIPDGRGARTACGVSTDQAFEYCTGDQTIYVGQNLLWAFYQQAGDAAPAVALAHEWGHHLQNMLGVPFARTLAQAIAYENQADCVSGAWASFADEQGWLETEDDVGDVETLMRFIGSGESRSRDHGTSAERAQAFETGFGDGVAACSAYFPDSPIG
jgi:predicted metalloprotease